MSGAILHDLSWKYAAAIVACLSFGMEKQAQARDLNAGFVLEKMETKQRYGYVSGIVEGLAFSRLLRPTPDKVGSRCIYDWYYGNAEHWKLITAFFKRHPDKPAAALLYVMLKKECGE